ncbi:MAG: Hpt domain-containing protein [Hyphomicrobiaceae bacterium]|nr:Hpt domain-containing protein [Hyphomicrobiaceae bacterium]
MNAKLDEALLLDADHLKKYTLGDLALEREVLGMFLDQSRLYLKRLQSPKDPKDWGEAAHSLKGSASAVGAFKIAERAAQLEQVDEPFNSSVCTAMLALLQSDLEETGVAIIYHLDNSTEATFI